MSPATETDGDLIEGKMPDPQDVLFLDWGWETYKQTIPRLDAGLQRVITLATALLGGTAFIVSDAQLAPCFRGTSMVLFMAALTAALAGTQLHRESTNLNDPVAIEKFKVKVIDWRDWWLTRSYAALWTGLWVAMLGIFFRWVNLA